MAYHPFRHLGLKFVALVLASLLWLTVAGEHVVERILAVPVEFRNKPAHLEVVGNPPDSVENGNTQTTFDGAWKKAKLTEADYMKIYADAEALYTRALQGLINHLKASGT